MNKNIKKKEGEYQRNRSNGITLIALVVTIIILLILAGVALTAMINGGIFDKAKEATEQTQIGKEKEQIATSYAKYKLESAQGKETTITIDGASVTGSDTEGWTITFDDTGNTYTIQPDGTISIAEAEIEDVENYILKWNCGYSESYSAGTSTSAVKAYLVKSENNDDEYTLIFKGKGKMDSAVKWTINDISCAWTRGDSVSAEIESYKSKITKVIISDGITELSDDCLNFYHCNNINEIEFAKSVIITKRNQVAYATKWLENQRKINPLVIVNNSVVDGLTCTGTVVIPENIKIICEQAFWYNKSITEVKAADNIEIIGNSAFDQCEGLKKFYYSKSLKNIGERAFNMCTALENIDLPEGLKTIGKSGFSCNYALTCSKIVIPSTVKELGNYEYPSDMFYACGKNDTFVEFEVPEANQYYKSEDGILYTKDGSILVAIPIGKKFENNTYIMPDTVTTLGEYSFSKNQNISTVVISDNLIIQEDTTNEQKVAGLGYTGNSLALAIYVCCPVMNYEVKDTNTHYTTGNRIVKQTGEFGDKTSGSFLLTKDGTELVAMPCMGTSMYRMLPSCVTTIRKNAFYIWQHYGSEPTFSIANGMYSHVHFRINENTTNIDSEQLKYINWLAKDTTNRGIMHLEIQNGTNSKYEIVDNQYVEKQDT